MFRLHRKKRRGITELKEERNLINSLPSLEAGHPFIVISISAALTDKIQLITLVFSESEKRRQRAAMNQKQKKKERFALKVG